MSRMERGVIKDYYHMTKMVENVNIDGTSNSFFKTLGPRFVHLSLLKKPITF